MGWRMEITDVEADLDTMTINTDNNTDDNTTDGNKDGNKDAQEREDQLREQKLQEQKLRERYRVTLMAMEAAIGNDLYERGLCNAGYRTSAPTVSDMALHALQRALEAGELEAGELEAGLEAGELTSEGSGL